MKRTWLFLLFIGASLSGCLDEGNSVDSPDDKGPETEPSVKIRSSHLVDYSSGGFFVTDVVAGPECEILTSEIHDKWQMFRKKGSKVTADHTELEFTLTVENMLSSAGYTGYRIGAYYDHELVFWTEPYMDSASFTHELDGLKVDLDKDKQWTFFFKRTDPLTHDDPDACTAGHGLQERIDVQIRAR